MNPSNSNYELTISLFRRKARRGLLVYRTLYGNQNLYVAQDCVSLVWDLLHAVTLSLASEAVKMVRKAEVTQASRQQCRRSMEVFNAAR